MQTTTSFTVSVNKLSDSRFTDSVPWWAWPHVLSLDAPLVAIAWLWSLEQLVQCNVPHFIYLLLFLVVWIIYLVDRLLDVKSKLKLTTMTLRHGFSSRNFEWLAVSLLPWLIISVIYLVLVHLPLPLAKQGLYLGSFFALVYSRYWRPSQRWSNVAFECILIVPRAILLTMPLIRWFWTTALGGVVLGLIILLFVLKLMKLIVKPYATEVLKAESKEIPIAFIFALGCALAVNFYASLNFVFTPVLPTFALFWLALLNCWGISATEHRFKVDDDPHSIVQVSPRLAQYFHPIAVTVALSTFAAAFLLSTDKTALLFWLGIACSVVGLIILERLSQWLNITATRVIFDLVLLFPALLLWIDKM